MLRAPNGTRKPDSQIDDVAGELEAAQLTSVLIESVGQFTAGHMNEPDQPMGQTHESRILPGLRQHGDIIDFPEGCRKVVGVIRTDRRVPSSGCRERASRSIESFDGLASQFG